MGTAAAALVVSVVLLFTEDGLGTRVLFASEIVLLVGIIVFALLELRSRAALAQTAITTEREQEQERADDQEWTWLIDRDGRFVSSSDACERLLGRSATELVGQDILDFLSSDLSPDRMKLEVARRSALRTGWSVSTLEVRHRDQSRRMVKGRIVPLLGADGELVGWKGTLRERAGHASNVVAAFPRRADVINVLEGDEIDIFVQPIFDLATGQLVGAEALARFDSHPYRPPDLWFATARGMGLSEDLELMAVKHALCCIGDLPDGAYVGVNLSPGLIGDPRLIDLLETHDGTRVVIEVTEHSSITPDSYASVRRACRRLAELGVRTAVDDAGAGFASMAHVLELQPDIIKLDRSMAADIGTDPARLALVGSLVGFGHDVGADIVAEGIETPAQMEAFAEVGVRYGQGYGLARPARLPNLLASTRSDVLAFSRRGRTAGRAHRR